MPRISSKHQVTLPVETLELTGLSAGDEVTIEAEGTDRIVVSASSPEHQPRGRFRHRHRAGARGEPRVV